MASWSTRVRNGLLNALLLVGGLGVMVLLYGLVTRTFNAPPSPQRTPESTELVGTIIQVEVLNGAGVDRLAAEATHYLRDRGFDVVDVGNYRTFEQEQSVIIDRVGDPEAARKVAEALGLPTDRIRQEIRRQYYLDASVVIGHDYEQLQPFQNQQ